MRIVKQDLLNQFKCIADKCPMTCCSGWQILVDDESLERFERYKGPLSNNINNSIDWVEGAILQTERGDCAFLQDDGLCELICKEGESLLCDTCRLYPRHVEEYEDLREWCMSLSCPEVARLIVENEKGIEYIIEETDDEDPLEDEFEDFDLILFEKLEYSRDVIFRILRNTDLTISERMGIILEMAKELQLLYDEDEIFEMDDVCDKYKEESYINEVKDELDISFSGFIREDFDILYSLERLSDDWDEFLDLIKDYPYNRADGDVCIFGIDKKRHDLILENLLESLLYTYYLGAIYNGMIYAYTNMCIFMTIAVDSLGEAKKEKEGKAISIEEYINHVYRLSREIEHSDINIGTILEYFDLK